LLIVHKENSDIKWVNFGNVWSLVKPNTRSIYETYFMKNYCFVLQPTILGLLGR